MQEAKKSTDPYRPPDAPIVDEYGESLYQGKLYPITAISIATILGSSLAGGWLLQSNFDRLGRSSAKFVTLLLTLLSTIALLFASLVIPGYTLIIYGMVNIGVALLIMPVALFTLGDTLEQHEIVGRPFYSNLRAVMVGVFCLFAQSFILGLALFFFAQQTGRVI